MIAELKDELFSETANQDGDEDSAVYFGAILGSEGFESEGCEDGEVSAFNGGGQHDVESEANLAFSDEA